MAKIMTWKQFKKHVDTLMEKEHINENTTIEYIDVHDPRVYPIEDYDESNQNEVLVTKDEDGLKIFT